MDSVADIASLAFIGQVDRLLGSVLLRVLRCATSSALRDDGDLAIALCDAQGRSVIERGRSPVLRGALSGQVRAMLAQAPASFQPSADPVLIANAEPAIETNTSTDDPVFLVSAAARVRGCVDQQTFVLLVPLLPTRSDASSSAVSSSGGPQGAPQALYLALGARFARAPFSAPRSEDEGLRIDDLALASDPDLSALPPAVGPRYLPFSPAPPAAPPRLRDEEGAAIVPTVVDERSLPALLRRTGLARDAQNDLVALHAALLHGRRGLMTLLGRTGWDAAQAQCSALHDRCAQAVTHLLSALPAGFYAFADSLDEDGCGTTDVTVRATLLLRRDDVTLDLTDSADAVAGPMNLSAVASVAVLKETLFRLLHALAGTQAAGEPGFRLPHSDGLLAGLRLRLRRGSILAAQAPSAQALAVDETAQRLFDVLHGVFAQAAPAQVAAASAGTRSGLYLSEPTSAAQPTGLSSTGDRRITLPGGAGAAPTPTALCAALYGSDLPSIEALEASAPVRVQTLSLRQDSAGLGLRSGEPGWQRELVFLRPQHVTLAADRRRRPPYGLAGGGPGASGHDVLRQEGLCRKLPAKAVLRVQAGDAIETDSPGGAGHGDAQRAAFFASLFDGGS